MSDDAKFKIGVEGEVVKGTGKKIKQELDKELNTVAKNGYIKLPVEVTKFKYPKQTTSKSGVTRGMDYSKLQKAQDELISNWNKLSKQGFSSSDDELLNLLKSFRVYQKTAKSQYHGNISKENEDAQLLKIRNTIGKQIMNHFIRVLGNVPIGGGKNGMFTAADTDDMFEQYAKSAIQKSKAARAAGIDLSKETLTKSDKAEILKKEKELEKEVMAEKAMVQREYERKNAKQIQKEQQAQLAKIQQQREEDAKNAIAIPKGKIPDVGLTTTEVPNLAAPTDYKQTNEDKLEDRKFLKRARGTAAARRYNTPNNDISLGERTQVWDPTYLTEAFMKKMERGGTYVDSNALLRQTMQALPEEIKKSIASLVTKIDMDKTNEVFNKFNSSERKQWSDLAGETGMSQLLLTNVAKVQNALMTGKEGTTPDDLKNAIIVALSDAVNHGKSQIAAENYNKAVIGIGNMLMARFDNSKDSIGGKYQDGERGVGINYNEVAKTLKDVFSGFQKTAEDLIKRAVKEFPEFYGESSVSKSKSKNKTKEKDTIFDRTYQAKLEEAASALSKDIKDSTSATEKQGKYDRIEYSAERVADSKEGAANRELKDIVNTDAKTGMNTESNTQELFTKLNDIYKNITDSFKPNGSLGVGTESGTTSVVDILSSILNEVTAIADKLGVKRTQDNLQGNLPMVIPPEVSTALTVATQNTGLPDLYRYFDEKGIWKTAGVVDYPDNRPGLRFKEDKSNIQQLNEAHIYQEHARELQEKAKKQETSKTIKTGGDPIVTYTKDLADAFNSVRKTLGFGKKQSEVDRIMNMNREQQEELLARRRKEFGFANTMRNAADTGDVTGINRTGDLWRRNGDKNPNNPFRNLKITEGIELDSAAINDALQSAIERNQFKAQTGGGFFKQLLGSMTMYIGQDSLEKSRTEAEGLNSVMALMRDAISDLVAAIQVEESALRGMERSGQAVFNTDGTLNIEASSSEAITTAARMEEMKMGLTGVLAEAEMTDDIVESVGGNIKEILQNLGFVSPELQKCNKIIKNINAGLDKNGKALKFQKRTQEVLNYSYQLMARHIGQMFKNWLMMLNPLNGIKRLFSDFASYDTKWQRTMNVIKYNLRRVVKPMMEWIAQQLVNMIGLVNALMKGIGSAFGQNWDLFDKDAANAEKIREELEAAANVSAGFDELHDIGSGNSAGEDLSGDIYTPQWDGLNKVLEDIGTTIGNIVKTVSDWTFWDWLILAGAALGGFVALKWLIGLFSNKNPLQSVADGFKTLQTTVGWAILIASFALFTKVLIEFVECMKTADWEDICKTLLTLAGVFAELVLAIGGLMYIGTALNVALPAMLGLAAVVGVFALFVLALAEFIKVAKECTSEEMLNAWAGLAAGLATVGLVVMALLIALSAIIATGVGAIAIVALAAILGVIALIIVAMADFVRALGEAGEGIKLICEGMATIVTAIGEQISNYVQTLGKAIEGIINSIANGIKTVLEPILGFIDGVIGKVLELAKIIAHEIGETIRTVIKTTGDIILGIINAIVNAIPTLLNSILNFVREIGPAIENSVDSIIRSITKLINFMVSGIEYMMNLVVDGMNGIISAINSVSQYVGIHIPRVGKVSIARFVPQYETGTNYVPNDGLAYLHQGEAVVPKKYNTPYQPGTLSPEERAYMSQMMNTMKSLDNTMKQGINVNGQFIQRGSDLVAVVNKTKSQTGADLLSNVSYAR